MSDNRSSAQLTNDFYANNRRCATAAKGGSKDGQIMAVIGFVVVVHFDSDRLPILNALEVQRRSSRWVYVYLCHTGPYFFSHTPQICAIFS